MASFKPTQLPGEREPTIVIVMYYNLNSWQGAQYQCMHVASYLAS